MLLFIILITGDSIGVGDGPAGPVLAGPLFQFNDIHHYYMYYIKTVTLCVDVDACLTREFSLWSCISA